MKSKKILTSLLVFVVSIFVCNLDVSAYVCRRASTLHTNGTDTYGNLGSGSTLTTGDAFDCDVNGDGTYDSATERFYYVSSIYETGSYGFKGFNDSHAVLIYYKNVGEKTIYGYYGTTPTSALEQLPSNWSNVSLKNKERTIFNSSDEIKETFNYGSSSSRLITYQEIINGCGSLSGHGDLWLACQFMFENLDSDGYWLETHGTDNNTVYIVDREYGSIAPMRSDYMGGQYQVRPVIEVPVEDIASDDATLNKISLYDNSDNGVIVATKTDTANKYAATIGDKTNVLKVVVEPNNSNATVKINGSSSNLVSLSTGKNTITIVITSQDGRNSETYTIDAYKPEPINCNFTLKNLNLTVGEKYDYKATLPTTFASDISIGDNYYATISNGVITGKKAGSTTIKVNYGSCATKTATLTVVNSSTNVKKEQNIQIAVGQDVDLKEYTKGYEIDTWVSSNINAISLKNGVVTGLKIGEGTVTATGNNIKYTFNISVMNNIKPNSGSEDVSLLSKDENATIDESKLSEDSDQYKDAKNSIKDAIKIEVFDIKVTGDGEKTVVFSIPDGMEKEKIAVYFLESDKYVRVDAELVDGKIQVKNAKTGIYVIAEFDKNTGIADANVKTTIANDVENPKTGAKLPVVIAVVGYIAIAAIAIYLKRKNKLSRI